MVVKHIRFETLSKKVAEGSKCLLRELQKILEPNTCPLFGRHRPAQVIQSFDIVLSSIQGVNNCVPAKEGGLHHRMDTGPRIPSEVDKLGPWKHVDDNICVEEVTGGLFAPTLLSMSRRPSPKCLSIRPA
jgi:hypothetical protein